jgi:hypothetical protein
VIISNYLNGSRTGNVPLVAQCLNQYATAFLNEETCTRPKYKCIILHHSLRRSRSTPNNDNNRRLGRSVYLVFFLFLKLPSQCGHIYEAQTKDALLGTPNYPVRVLWVI